MSAVLAFIFALALGNLLAIGVHAFTWWLRKWSQARLAMAIVGALVLLLVLWGFGYLVWGDSSGHSWDSDGPPALPGWQIPAAISILKFTLTVCAIVGIVGAVQMRQIPANWLVATFCFCFEVLFAFQLPIALESIGINLRLALGFYWTFKSTPAAAFMFSLMALALFRPLAVKIFHVARNLIFENHKPQMS